MSDIELVIKIPEEIYELCKRDKLHYEDASLLEYSVANGKPLPKGHGRLCDLDAALRCVNDDSVKGCDAKWQAIGLFEWAMTKRVVIEADKAESEDNE